MLKNIFGNNVKNCGTIKSIFFQQCFFFTTDADVIYQEKKFDFSKNIAIYILKD